MGCRQSNHCAFLFEKTCISGCSTEHPGYGVLVRVLGLRKEASNFIDFIDE